VQVNVVLVGTYYVPDGTCYFVMCDGELPSVKLANKSLQDTLADNLYMFFGVACDIKWADILLSKVIESPPFYDRVDLVYIWVIPELLTLPVGCQWVEYSNISEEVRGTIMEAVNAV
jgi:hypothetical protein